MKLDLKLETFIIIANMLLKSSAFIRNLNMHLYQNNINLKIDILCSLSCMYVFSIFSVYLF